MKKPTLPLVLALLAPAVAAGLCTASAFAEPSLEQRGMSSGGFRQHDRARPQPKAVEPGAEVSVPAPADAVVLLGKDDGANAKQWKNAGWKFKDGVMAVAPGKRTQISVQAFGDCQLHAEFRIPETLKDRKDQDQGNSGIFFMGEYEAQVLSSHPDCNKTYADGMAGAIYGQNPPLVNANRKIGGWNAYDIVFRRPRFNDKGECVQKAVMTVHLNGVLVQDHFELMGPTSYMKRQQYKKHADKLPFELQDHGSPTEFRNMWVRELE